MIVTVTSVLLWNLLGFKIDESIVVISKLKKIIQFNNMVDISQM